MEYHGDIYGKIGRRFVKLRMTSKDVDEAMEQNSRIPRSGLALAQLLARHGIIDARAIEDPQAFDNHLTLDRIYAAHAEMVLGNDQGDGSPETQPNQTR